MKKREYKTPTINVVKLEQQCQILAGSESASRAAGLNNYTVESEQDW